MRRWALASAGALCCLLLCGNAGAAQGTDLGGGPDKTEYDHELEPMDSYVAFELDFGGNAWLGGGEGDLERTEPVAGAFGGGIWYAPWRDLAFGLTFTQAGLGGENTGTRDEVPSLRVDHDVATAWLRSRFTFFRPSDAFSVYASLGIGLSWQHIVVSGTEPGATPFVDPPRVFECDAREGPHVAFGGGPGMRVGVTHNVAFYFEGNVAVHTLSSEPLSGCSAAPGVGTAVTIAGMAGLSVAFDTAGGSAATAQRF